MKFDPKALPKGVQLVGMGPVPEAELEKLRELDSVCKDAEKRFLDLSKRAQELQIQFIKTNTALEGRLVELGWKMGYDPLARVYFDEENGMAYALKQEDNGNTNQAPDQSDT